MTEIISYYFKFFDHNGKIMLGHLNDLFNITNIEKYHYTGDINTAPYYNNYQNNIIWVASKFNISSTVYFNTAVNHLIIFYDNNNIGFLQRSRNLEGIYNSSTSTKLYIDNSYFIKNVWFSRCVRASGLKYNSFTGLKMTIEP